MLRTITASMLVLALTACGGAEAPPAPTPAEPAPAAAEAAPSKAEQAAAVAKEIRANPDGATAVLEKHGMTTAAYEALLFEVAADPALSEQYLAALNN